MTANDKMGLGAFGETRKNKTTRPQKIEPQKFEEQHRSMPNDQVLIKPKRRLAAKDTPKSVQAQLDTHMAIKQIATIENKRNYEVLNEIVESYVQNMPNQSKKLVMDSVRAVQQNMHDF